MKISKINETLCTKSLAKKADDFVSKHCTSRNIIKVAGIFIAGGLLMQYGEHSADKRIAYKIQQKVQQTGISQKDFDKLDNRISTLDSKNKAIAWQEALDSIKNQGKIEKAYYEGFQAAKAKMSK